MSDLRVPDDPDYGDAYLKLSATGRGGATGHHKEELRYSDDPVLRVATDKILYGPQDPIEVTLTSNQHGFTVFVEAIADGRVLASQALAMDGGRASVVLPPNLKFQGEVTISAYGFKNAVDNDELRSVLSGSRDVLFPKNHALQLDAQPEKSTYRPGDEATVNLRVTVRKANTSKALWAWWWWIKPWKSASARTRRFGGRGGFMVSCVSDDICKGIRRSDLDKLDLSRPLPPAWTWWRKFWWGTV